MSTSQGQIAPLSCDLGSAVVGEAHLSHHEEMESQCHNTKISVLQASHYPPLGTAERHRLDEQLAALKRLELERRQQEEAARGCVFRPSINPSPAVAAATPQEATEQQQVHHSIGAASGSSARGGESVFERLRQQAEERARRRQEREEAKMREEELRQRSGFKPTINRNTPFDKNLKHLEGIPVEERLQFYGQAVARTAELRRQQKERAEAERVGAVHHRARHQDPADRQKAQQAFNERNEKLLTRREQQREMAAQKAASEMTFQPKISATSAAIDRAARERGQGGSLGYSSRGESHRRHQAKPVTYEDLFSNHPAHSAAPVAYENDFAHSSHVSPRSRKSTSGAGRPAERGVLLYERALQSEKDKEALREREELRRTFEEHNFNRPRTNPLSEEWIQYGNHQELFETDFVSRQQLYEEAKQQQRQELVAKQAEQESERRQRNWRRGVPSARGGIKDVEKGADVVSPQELEEQVQRLYYKPLSSHMENKTAVHASECPFKPQLSIGTELVLRRLQEKREKDFVKRLATDTRSGATPEQTGKSDGSKPSREELYAAPTPRRQSKQENVVPKRWDSSPRRFDVTGSPMQADSASPAGVSSRLGGGNDASERRVLRQEEINQFYARQMQTLQVKEEKVKQMKQRELVDEMAQCTFRPKTSSDDSNHRKSQASTPAETAVPGVQGFLARQAEAKRQKAMMEKKVRTMGQPKPSATTTRTLSGATIVSPFKLQTESRRGKAPAAANADNHIQQRSSSRRAHHAATSSFAFTTEERERFFEGEYPQHSRAVPVDTFFSSGYTEEMEEAAYDSRNFVYDEDQESGSSFDVHHVSPPTTTLCSNSGGETCSPRLAGMGHRLSSGSVPPTGRLAVEDARRGRGNVPAPKTSRSVSFADIPDSPPDHRLPHTDAATDAYTSTSLLAKLRHARRA